MSQVTLSDFVAATATKFAIPGVAVGVWADGREVYAYHGVTSADHQNRVSRLTTQGYRMIDVSGYEYAGQAYYAAIWVQSDGRTWQARQGSDGT